MGFIDSFNPEQPILPQIRAFKEARNPVFTAVEELTDQPPETRRQFVDEYTGWLQSVSTDPEVVANPRSAALTNIGYAAGYSGDFAAVDRVLDRWREADTTLVHPIFGSAVPHAETVHVLGEISVVEKLINDSRS